MPRARKTAPLPEAGSILSLAAAEAAVAQARAIGKRVIWTNGCFDLLHAGHLRNLTDCKALGDVLIVGINSDASVRKLKGPDRPLQPARERAALVAALRPVDWVVIFRGASPLSALKRVKPDIFAKGGDYTLETMNQQERRSLERMGAAIRFLPFLPGHSTSETLRRVQGVGKKSGKKTP